MRPFPWLDLPRIDPTHLQLLAPIAGVARSPAFGATLSDLLQTPCKIEHGRVTTQPSFDIDHQDGFVARATTVPDHLPFYVWLPASTCTGLLPALFDPHTPSTQISPDEWGALAALCLGALHTAIHQGLMPCRLEANPPPPELIRRDLHQPTLELVVVFRGSGIGRHFIRLLFPEPTARRLACHSTPVPTYDDALGRVQLHLPVTCDIGPVPTPLPLEPGDVLLTDHDLQSFLKTATANLSHHTLRGTLDPNQAFQFIVQHLEPRPMSDETTTLTHSEVHAEVRIGQVKLPIATLATLAPGTILTLDTRPGDPVEIVIADQVIARAELVLVDDRVGCRILQRLK